MKLLLAVILLSGIPAAADNIYSFTVPNRSTMNTPAGLATGWGYTIQNQSSTDWLVTTGLSAGSFLYASPEDMFDFPALPPGTTVMVAYDPSTPAGLYQILWDQNAPPGSTNFGTFTLSAQWWSGNPINGGTLLAAASDASQPYLASLTSSPEPSTLLLLSGSLLVAGLFRLRRNHLSNRFPDSSGPGRAIVQNV